MSGFSEIIKRVHLINDLILSDMTSEKKDYSEELTAFRRHILTTKDWFSRISWANKKRFVLALLDDVKSVWTISLLLKSIWNCRPKDAVLSVCQPRILSSYDQVPMDHNRTALPLSVLKEVMTKDRLWFLRLEPESQAVFLAELLIISGGPIMWEVLQSAQATYDAYLEQQLQDLQNCNAVETPAEKTKLASESGKKDQNTPRKPSGQESGKPLPGQAQKELDAAQATWNLTIKSIRDRMKLEEIEMEFNDGTRKRVWKVNRPKPEATETVDFVQLLPSETAKKILLCLPTAQLSDCARVNKYWSYLVDELRSELNARQKINIELEKLKENMVRHDASLNLLSRPEFQFSVINSSVSVTQFSRGTKNGFSTKTNALSYKLMLPKKRKARSMNQKPIRNLTDFNERLERRGAADENLWAWCENVLNDDTQIYEAEDKKETEGLICLDSEETFPCPLMKENFNVPLKLPLVKDPVQSAPVKSTGNISEGDHMNHNLKQGEKRYSLWSKDMSGLYPVCKLPSYQFK